MVGRAVTRRQVGPVLCIVIACAVVFTNTLENSFHLDDFYRVDGNPGVEEFWPPWRHFIDPTTSSRLPRIVQFRPLLPLSLSINFALFGASLVAYHLGNLLFHTLASLLVFGVVRQLLDGRTLPAMFCALLFAVHPVGGITVNYICSRDLGLMQMFFFASMWIYLRLRWRREGSPVWLGLVGWTVCLGCFVLALLSKTSAVVLPGILVLYEVTLAQQRVRSWLLWSRVLPFVLCVVGWFCYTRFGLGFSDYDNVVTAEDKLDYAARQLQHHVFHYLRNFAWPFPIRQAAHDAVEVWRQVVGAICLLASWAVAAIAWRRWPLLAFCILSYQLSLLPTSSWLPLWADVVAYRPYAGSPFLFLGVVWVVFCRQWLGVAVSVVLVGYFSTASIILNRTWRDEQSLWRHSVAYGGDALAHMNLGMSFADPAERRPYLQQAVARNPHYILAHINLGLVEIALGEALPGLRRIEDAVAMNPAIAQSQYWLAVANHGLDQHAVAAEAAVAAVRLQPDALAHRYAAGWYLQLADRVPESLPHLEFVLAVKPAHEEAEYLAGYALQLAGHRRRAIGLYESFVDRHPEHDRAWFNLGLARLNNESWAPAIKAFTRCLRANPNNRVAHLHLATCYRAQGDETRAAQHQRAFEQSR